ncbi:sodium/phosphate symporter [Haladaptatus caseinilyticus]|uniref:sodium/phosphate symporter n=1 Tax=Haladaptatus caseinilyticus TaxID=2993314 RepID=UPI00224B6E68|nr:sodium/phosphate symporter [Haladaptatus caseinilyticus]
MTNRRPYVFIGITVFMVAVAMRTIPLYWSYLPFNLDGLQFAAPARYTLSHGHLPTSYGFFHPDKYTFSALLTICSQLTGISPLRIAQPAIAVIGSVPCLIAVWLTRRIGHQLQWNPVHTRIAAALAGLVLATEGVYLGRSAAVTSEGLGLVFVAILAIVFYRLLQTGRWPWIVLTALLIAIFPLTHNLSTMIGALVITALLAVSVRQSTGRVLVAGGLAVIAFWIYLSSYYSVMGMNELSRVSSVPGLFLAWIIVLFVAAVWIPSTSVRTQRSVPMFALFGGVGVLVANFFVPVFPGTASLHMSALLFSIPIICIGLLATHGLPYITVARDGVIGLALLLGPLTLIGFGLTGRLTIEYQGLIVRGQIFLHLVAAILAALAVVSLSLRGDSSSHVWNGIRAGFVPLLLVAALMSAPLAFTGLHATSAQAVIAPSEYESTTFAANYVPNTWVSDGHLSRLALYYYPRQTNATYTPMYQWAQGGGMPPTCTVVSQSSWTTLGVQLFPDSPKRISASKYQQWIAKQNMVYTTSGNDQITITRPIADNGKYC